MLNQKRPAPTFRPLLLLLLRSQGPVAVETTKLTCKVGKANQGKFSTAKQVLKDMSLQIPKGGRCMLVGTNGSGKSTLMRVLAGKHFVPQGMATVHQRDAYHDTKLSDCVGHSLDWWQETEWDLSVADVVDNVVLDERAQELVRILAVDMAWRMNRVSSGQRKRIQLLINLLHYKSVLILDEVCVGLLKHGPLRCLDCNFLGPGVKRTQCHVGECLRGGGCG